jgi:hypothetical protein
MLKSLAESNTFIGFSLSSRLDWWNEARKKQE